MLSGTETLYRCWENRTSRLCWSLAGPVVFHCSNTASCIKTGRLTFSIASIIDLLLLTLPDVLSSLLLRHLDPFQAHNSRLTTACPTAALYHPQLYSHTSSPRLLFAKMENLDIDSFLCTAMLPTGTLLGSRPCAISRAA